MAEATCAVVALPPRSGVLMWPSAKTPSDCCNDAIVGHPFAEVIEHHRPGPNRTDRIRDSFSGDIRCRTMNGFEH